MLELDYFLLIYCNRSFCIYPQFLVYPQFLLLPPAPFIRPAKQNPDPAFIPISTYRLHTCLPAAGHSEIKLNEEDGSHFNFKIDKWKRTFRAAHVLWCPHQMYCDLGITVHFPSLFCHMDLDMDPYTCQLRKHSQSEETPCKCPPVCLPTDAHILCIPWCFYRRPSDASAWFRLFPCVSGPCILMPGQEQCSTSAGSS